MMESLFRLTELESNIPLNLNVLIKGRMPKVVGLAEALREWLDHLPRRADPPLATSARARSSIGWKSSAATWSPI